MTAYVQDDSGTNWDGAQRPILGTGGTGVDATSGNMVVFVATCTVSGTPSVSSSTLSGDAPDGSAIFDNGTHGVYFAWWNSLSTGGTKEISAAYSNLSETDSWLLEFSGFTGTPTTVDGSNSATNTTATAHSPGTVSAGATGSIVVMGARFDAASGATTFNLTEPGADQGSREICQYNIGTGSVVGSWTTSNAVTSFNVAIVLDDAAAGGQTSHQRLQSLSSGFGPHKSQTLGGDKD